jgi:hypothetical protein
MLRGRLLMPLLSPGTLNLVRQQRQRTLTHTYTWVERLGDAQDPEGGTVVTWAPPVIGKPCHLLPMQTARVDPSGAPIEVQAPRLVVPWDDPLDDGDLVRDVTVRNTDGTPMVILPGPSEVMQVVDQLAADAPTHRLAILSFEAPRQ